MTITSGFARPGRRSTAAATTPIEVAGPIFDPLGVDDPGTAHGGHPRQMPGPPVADGLVRRVRPPVVLRTKVRRIHTDTRGALCRDDLAGTRPAPTPDSTAEVALLGG